MELTTTKRLARVAGVHHDKILTEVSLCANALKRNVKKVELTEDLTSRNYAGYELPDDVALLVATKYNIELRKQVIQYVAKHDPELMRQLVTEVQVVPVSDLPWHERITYAKPSVSQTGDAMVTLAKLANAVPCCIATVKRKLIEAGIGFEDITGFKPTKLGQRYSLAYKRQYVWDKEPLLDILRQIESHKW